MGQRGIHLLSYHEKKKNQYFCKECTHNGCGLIFAYWIRICRSNDSRTIYLASSFGQLGTTMARFL